MSVKIGIIDSGINPWHSHVGGIEGGIAFHLESEARVTSSSDFSDELGHGTAIAGIIREKAPFSRLYAVKIFHQSLSAPLSLLKAALTWSIEEKMKIIHLSLGLKGSENEGGLKELCERAFQQNIIIVAAARNADDLIWPAAFETVIGVYWLREAEADSLVYHPEKKIEFGAYGWPRPLPGYPSKFNFSGSSFAAAHVTGRVAQVLENNPGAGVMEVKEMIIKPPLKGGEKLGVNESGTKKIMEG
jgi:subtilisin family serine protease